MNRSQIAAELLKVSSYGGYGAQVDTQKKAKTFKPVSTKTETPTYDTSYIGYSSKSLAKLAEYNDVKDIMTVANSRKKIKLAKDRLDASKALRKLNDGRR